MGYSHGRRWSEAQIIEELERIALEYGRMPSVNELKSHGMNSLATTIALRGGFKSWAKRLGLQQKGTETHRGIYVQKSISQWLESQGFSVVEQTMRAPYDLLVNGIRIDVKSARYSDYGLSRGFFFGINKQNPTCDLYILCGMNETAETILWHYFIPSDKAMVQTITITPNGKYLEYLEAIDQIHRLGTVA